jgi:MFS family permease
MSTTASSAAAAASTSRTPPLRGLLAGLALSTLLPSLGISIVHVALPTFADTFAAPFQQVQWLVIVYLLVTTTLIVGVGRLGDVIGRRRLLSIGIVVFTGASALAGMAPGLGLLLAARALQGLGAAVMMALAMAFVGEVVPKSRAGRAMGLLGTMSAVGTALGPSLGGVLMAHLGWQALFFVNLPLGLAAWALVVRHLPADRPAPAQAPHFDVAGMLWLAFTLGAYALAVTIGQGRIGPVNLALLLAAGLGLWCFARSQRRAASPLVPLTRLREPALRAGLVMSALVSTVVMSTLVVGPFYLSRTLGLDAVWVGLVMSTGPVMAAVTGVPAGRLVDRVGARRVTAVALAGMLAGCLALAMAPASLGPLGYALPLAFMTAHYAMFQTANNTGVMTDVPADQRGVVSGLLNLSRNLGLITGASLMGAVFAFASGSFATADGPAAAALAGMRVSYAVAALMVVGAIGIALKRR